MPQIIRDRKFDKAGQLIVPICMATPAEWKSGTAHHLEAKIDTGHTLSRRGSPVGLILPRHLRQPWEKKGVLCPERGLVAYRTADGGSGTEEAFLFYVQIVCDDRSLWPETPMKTRAIFLDRRDDPPLIGHGIWMKWRTLIDGPKGHFSVSA